MKHFSSSDDWVMIKIVGVSGKISVKEGNVVGYCRYHLHPGYLTKSLVKKHKCIEKKCHFLDKSVNPAYWERFQEQQKPEKHKKPKESYDEIIAYANEHIRDGFTVHGARMGENQLLKLFYTSYHAFDDSDMLTGLERECKAKFKMQIKFVHIKNADGEYVAFQ